GAGGRGHRRRLRGRGRGAGDPQQGPGAAARGARRRGDDRAAPGCGARETRAMTVITEVEGQRLLREDVAAARLPRDVVRATGEDALDYLQGQLSQDLAALGPGAATYSLVLEPAGKVDAWVRLWRADEDAGGFLLEVEAGAGEALVARLERFRLRVQVELELLRWSLVAVRGPASPPVEQLAPAAGEGGFATAVDWAGLPGVDLL